MTNLKRERIIEWLSKILPEPLGMDKTFHYCEQNGHSCGYDLISRSEAIRAIVDELGKDGVAWAIELSRQETAVDEVV